VPQRKIGKEVGCAIRTVEHWVARFKEARAHGIPDNVSVLDKHRPGGPQKITTSIGKAILKFTEGKPNRQTPAIRQHIYEKFGVDLSERCIQLWLKAEGLHPYHRERQLRLLQQHKRKRVVFARRFMNHDWMTTLFTDETEFPLVPTKAVNTKDDIVWCRRKADVPPKEVEQYTESLRVWGGVSATGKTRLVFYRGELTARRYCDVLGEAKEDFDEIFGETNEDWTFQHDGASPHKARLTNDWLSENVPNHITSGPVFE